MRLLGEFKAFFVKSKQKKDNIFMRSKSVKKRRKVHKQTKAAAFLYA